VVADIVNATVILFTGGNAHAPSIEASVLEEIRVTTLPKHFEGADVIISDAPDELMIVIAPAREGSSVAPEVRVLVENRFAIILVDFEGAGFVIPVVPDIAPATSLLTSCSILCLPSFETSMLIHFCNAISAIHENGANVIVLHLFSELLEVVVANEEGSSATTKVRVLVQNGSALTIGALAALAFRLGWQTLGFRGLSHGLPFCHAVRNTAPVMSTIILVGACWLAVI